MESTSYLKVACVAFATWAASGAFAQEAAENAAESAPAAEAAESSAEGKAEGKAEAPLTAPAAPGKDFRFLPLMRCAEVKGGTLELRLPDAQGWTAAVPPHYYPFGSEVRLTGSADAFARLEIGPKASLTLTGPGSFSTRKIAIGEKTRTVLLGGGIIGVDVPRSLKDGLITVASPDFVCANIAGESRFECAEGADGREVAVRVVTGSMGLEGRHYRIPRMGAANQVRICTSPDALLTSLRGESGDYTVSLDCGIKSVLDPETGKNKDVPQTIEFALSPKCAVKIWRKVSEKSAGGSGRMAVAVQTFDAQGKDKNFRAFFEDRANVNTGELVVSPKDTAKDESEKNKSAAEDVEEVSASGESKDAQESTGDSGSSSEEGSSGNSSEGGGGAASAPAADAGDGL